MAKAKPVTIGKHHFERQTDAMEFFSSILQRYHADQDVDEDDAELLGLLLRRHIRYSEKVGLGLRGFCVMISPEGSKCFGVIRIDGTREPFSYKYCVSQNW